MTQAALQNGFPIVSGRCSLSKLAGGLFSVSLATLATSARGATGALFGAPLAQASVQAGFGGGPPAVVARLAALVVTNASSAPAWEPGATYSQGAVVADGGVAYASTQNGNTNNAPPSSAWWNVQATRMTLPPTAIAASLLDAVDAAILCLGVAQGQALPASPEDLVLLGSVSGCLFAAARVPGSGYVAGTLPPISVIGLSVP